MALLAFPIEPSTPNQRMDFALDGTRYVFEFRWNDRDQAWFMSMFDEQESPIMESVKITLGSIIGSHYVDPRKPPGPIFAADLSNLNQEAGIDDLGERVQVYYSEVDA